MARVSPAPPPSRPPIFTSNFLLVCFANLTAFGSFYFLLATLPLYIVRIGGRETEVGFIIGVFAATSLMLRPLVGKASDRWGRKRLLLGGALLLLLSSLLYNVATSTLTLLALRIVHGVGWAAFTTTAMAMVADIVPPQRRGEGVGYFGMSINIAMAVAPAAGVLLTRAFSFTVLFLVATSVALAAGLFSLLLTEPVRQPGPSGESSTALIEPAALFPSGILGLLALTYGSIVSFLPLFALQRGIDNPGLFFTVFAIVVLLLRGPAGWLSDRYGRAATIIPGILLAAAGLGLLSQAASSPMFLGVAFLYGAGFAAAQPSLMALTIDRVSPAQRGAAMGTFGAAMDLGIGSGSFLWGVVAQGFGFVAMYQAAAATAVVAVMAFLAGSRGKPTPAIG